MTTKEHIDFWINSAEADYDTALVNFNNSKFNWALFIGHLVLEKTLKALYIQFTNIFVPPKTHNLLKLAEISSIELSSEQKLLYADINRFNISARYPEYKDEIQKIANLEFTKIHLSKIREEFLWLKSQIR